MHHGRTFPVHFALRRLHRDALSTELLAPEFHAWNSPVGLQHLLYRCYDANLAPVYIGLTGCSGVRLDTRNSPWWPLAEFIAVSVYGSRDHLKEAERAALRHEQPRFNLVAVRGPANVKLPLHQSADAAAAVLFREAMPEFVAGLAALLAQPERFPQHPPPPPARFAEEGEH